MATLPADEDYARAMLSIFAILNVRAGESLQASRVRVEFQSRNMGRPADCEAALSYAVERGWLHVELGRIRLTAAGFAQMQI
ncbi:MAG: hypothetical protein ABSC22_00970 [Roseiarcus sp.]|jgi:hypothetical protein